MRLIAGIMEAINTLEFPMPQGVIGVAAMGGDSNQVLDRIEDYEERGIGAAWTTLHLSYEQECNDILGIPADYTTAALLPAGYFTGETFRKADRVPASQLTYWESWGQS